MRSTPSILPKPDLETLIFQSPSVTVGTFRCRADHPLFEDSGPSNAYCFVFPRTPVWIRHAGERPFLADPTVVTFLNEGQEYSRRRIMADGDRAEWFGVAPEIAAEVLGTVAPGDLGRGRRVFRRSHGPSDPATYVAQRQLVERLSAGAHVDPLETEETVVGLLARAVDSCEKGPQWADAARRQAFAENVRVLIARTLAHRLYLSDLAAALDCSVFHLCHRFKQVHGVTIHQYRHDLRLRTSLERLREGERDLMTLALDLGFSSHSHFTAAFRRHFGMTPSAFLLPLRMPDETTKTRPDR